MIASAILSASKETLQNQNAEQKNDEYTQIDDVQEEVKSKEPAAAIDSNKKEAEPKNKGKSRKLCGRLAGGMLSNDDVEVDENVKVDGNSIIINFCSCSFVVSTSRR